MEGRSRGAFSGGEIQRLRRLRQEGLTPTVLVAVSDSFTAALPQSAQGVSPGGSPVSSPQSRPVSHIPLANHNLSVSRKNTAQCQFCHPASKFCHFAQKIVSKRLNSSNQDRIVPGCDIGLSADTPLCSLFPRSAHGISQ